MKNCKQCFASFVVTDADRAFYDKVSPVFNGKKYPVPPPAFCPPCRSQRRLAFRNERNLYKRKSDLTGETILSLYSPDAVRTVHEHAAWYTDHWDPLAHGRDFDFSRSFSDQFLELLKVVPRPSLHVVANENCDYVNQCGYSKDCYLSFNSDFSRNCYYCTSALHSEDCVDVFNAEKSRHCFNSVDLQDCYQVFDSINCKNSHDLWFCRDMIGCADCFGCSNLRSKSYCYYNEQLTKDDYLKKIAEHDLGSYQNHTTLRLKAQQNALERPRRALDIQQCENAVGDHLLNCKNAFLCFDSFNDHDIAYCTTTSACKDTLDFDVGGYDCELCLEIVSSGDRNYHDLFGVNHWGQCQDTLYNDILIRCKNCFGCVSLRDKEYCILNKQYSKDEYEALVPKIIEHMMGAGEWGEFFSSSLSPFGYNETVAQEYFPLTREQALQKGFRWSDYVSPKPTAKKLITAAQLPDNIKEAPDDILNWAIECEASKKPFMITRQELTFYRAHGLPLPRKHPDERHRDRLALRNPRHLWARACANCQGPLQTTCAPDRPEKVYCESCYLKEVY